MTTFNIKDKDNVHKVVMDLSDNMLDLKNLIIKKMELSVDYIDLNFLIERPIRGMGKMNLDKGLLPRTMDNFPFNRYNIEGKEMLCEFILVKDYMPDIRNKTLPNSIYKPPSMKTPLEKKNTPSFNLESEIEFPSL
jgi:hypothetical protein